MVLRRFKLISFPFMFFIILLQISADNAFSQESLSPFDKKAKDWAISCGQEVVEQFNLLITSKQLSITQLFDTFYIPIPNTNPQKYHTQYDKFTDEVLQPILDKYLKKDKSLIFVVAVDMNGYMPTHNSRYMEKAEGGEVRSWSKRLINDRIGLAAARNINPYLLQNYSGDNGEPLVDISVPIFVDEKHWGALRIGYGAAK